MKRKLIKPGNPMPPIDAMPVIAGDIDLRDLNARLLEDGFRAPKSVKLYYAKDRRVTMTFVWRKRREDITITHKVIRRIPIGWMK